MRVTHKPLAACLQPRALKSLSRQDKSRRVEVRTMTAAHGTPALIYIARNAQALIDVPEPFFTDRCESPRHGRLVRVAGGR